MKYCFQFNFVSLEKYFGKRLFEFVVWNWHRFTVNPDASI